MNARTHGKRAVVVDLRAAAREREESAEKRSAWAASVGGVKSLRMKARHQQAKAIAERSLAVLLERAAQVIESTESVRVDAARGQLVLLALRKHGGAALVTEMSGQLRVTNLPTGVGVESLTAHYAERADAAEAQREAGQKRLDDVTHQLEVTRRELEQLRAQSLEVAEKAEVLRQVPSMMETLAMHQRALRETSQLFADRGLFLNKTLLERDEALADADALAAAYAAMEGVAMVLRQHNPAPQKRWRELHTAALRARERASHRRFNREAAAEADARDAEGWC